MNISNKKVAFITPYIIPRFVNLYNLLFGEIEKDNHFEIKFFIIKPKPVHRKHQDFSNYYSFNHVIMKTRQFYFEEKELAIDFPSKLFGELSSYDPDLIVLDGFGASYLKAYFFGVLKRKPLVFWNKNTSIKSIKNKTGILYFLKKLVLSQHSYFLAGGDSQRDYITYHYPRAKVDTIPFSLCLDKFSFNGCDKGTRNNNPSPRARVLYVGELIFRNGVDLLLNALHGLNQEVDLLIVGKGNQESELLKISRETGVNAKFVGFKDEKELIDLYSQADLLVVPSRREPWGIVVSEALAMGLYVVASDQVGASDLIEIDENGDIFRTGDFISLRACLRKACSNLEELRKGKEKRSDDFNCNRNSRIFVSAFIERIERFLMMDR